MGNIFFIGDTHFGHANILKFEPEYRPFNSIQEHDEKLVEKWNSVVRANDTVYHLGDVAFPTYAIKHLSRLMGKKFLVLGNHDWKKEKMLMPHFNRMGGVAYIDRKYILSHVPVHPYNFNRWKANIHGHLHSKNLDDPRYINVSVEQIGLTPISIEDINERCRSIASAF